MFSPRVMKLKFLPCVAGRGDGYQPRMVKLVDDHSHQNLWKATPLTTFVPKQCFLFFVFPRQKLLGSQRFPKLSPESTTNRRHRLIDVIRNNTYNRLQLLQFPTFPGWYPQWMVANGDPHGYTGDPQKPTTVLSKHIGSARPNAARAVPPQRFPCCTVRFVP